MLSVLCGDRLVARFDSKLDQVTNTFVLLYLWLEGEALGKALARGFARFVTFPEANKLDAKAIREPRLRHFAYSSISID